MPQFGGNWTNNPQMQQGRPYKWDPVQKKYVAPTGQTAGLPNNFGSQSGGGNWYDMIKGALSQGPSQVSAPQVSGDWSQYLTQATGAIPVQNVNSTNVSAPTMSNDYLKYLEAGVAPIDPGSMVDVSAVINATLPGIKEQQDRSFAEAAARAGATGMWGSPYATALGTASRRATEDITKTTQEYQYKAAESLAARQLQAEIANRANQLQAAGLSASQAQAQAQMELQASLANQGSSLQAALANQSANLQAQMQQRSNQLQAAGLSQQAAMQQAQMELEASISNQRAGQTSVNQMMDMYRTQLGQNESMLDRFLQQYGDIQSPDDLWKYISGVYGQSGANVPNYTGTYQTPQTNTGVNQNFNFPNYQGYTPTGQPGSSGSTRSQSTSPTISGGRPVGSPGPGYKWAWDGKNWVSKKI